MPSTDPVSFDSDLKSTAWWQWLRRCQLVRCEDNCRDYLETTLISRFRKQTRNASLGVGFDIFAKDGERNSSNSSDADLPYIFENWLKFFKKEVNRQCLKSYLQARSKGNASHLEALVTDLLRDYVRDLWRREGTEQIGGSSADSLNRPISKEDECTVGELLAGTDPQPGQEAELGELEDICSGCARAIYPEMTFDERLLLGGRAVGLGPSHPEILAKASVGQSVLYEKKKGIESKMLTYLRENFRNDLEHEPRMLVLLAKYTLKHLLNIARRDFFPEKSGA